MTDPERIREACNVENNPELPEGCMYPWCLCNRYPEGSMTRIETPDKDISLLREALEDALRLKGGWREAIVELEDHCSEPVRLKNMLAAADQLDAWATKARAALSATADPKLPVIRPRSEA